MHRDQPPPQMALPPQARSPIARGRSRRGAGCRPQDRLLNPWSSLPGLPCLPVTGKSPFGQNTAPGSWLWATLWPLPLPSLPALSSGPRQAPDPAVSLPPLLPLPLFCAQPGPAWPPPPCPHRRGPLPLPSPFSVSHSVPPQALFRKQPRCSDLQVPPLPPDVCTQGVTGQWRVMAAWAWVSEPLGSGASETQHPCHPQPPSLLPTPSRRAERSAAPRRLGVFVREAISEGVLWLGRPRERDWHRCREGEYALVSSRFTKTAHPACSPACAPGALGCRVQSPN